MKLTDTQLQKLRRHRVSGNRISKAVELTGVTLVEVAAGSGLPYSYVSDMARNRYRTHTVETAYKLCGFFGCAIEDLFPPQEAMSA
jgi:transcriptional regulator with XRE-family HTH domain